MHLSDTFVITALCFTSTFTRLIDARALAGPDGIAALDQSTSLKDTCEHPLVF
jgi:hypothetical protein